MPDLIERAYRNSNAARYLIVKGSRGWLAHSDGILETIDHPSEEAMEAIGGTGDTLTGIVATLIDSGMTIGEASLTAMRTNRIAGSLVAPTPASQVLDIIRCIPEALRQVLDGKKKGAPDD